MKLKTIKKVCEEYPEYATLIRAVVTKTGIDSVSDINNHGIDGGYPGFTYYEDTVRFAYRHRKAIIELLERDAEEIYYPDGDVVKMVSNFGYFTHNRDRKSTMDANDRKDLYRYLGGAKCLEVTIPNLMAWYAAETVCRWFEE